MTSTLWLSEYAENGELRFRIGREGDRLIADWPGVGTLRADPQRGTSSFEAAAGAEPEIVAKVETSLARALLRHLEAKLTLHGAAAQIGDVAVAMVGRSGDGKSTFAAALARRPRAAFLADDTLAIEFQACGVFVKATEQVSWLVPDARAAFNLPPGEYKSAASPPRVAEGAPLRLLVVPAFGDVQRPTLERIRGVAVLAGLVPAVVRFVIDDPAVQMREIEQLERLASAVPIYSLVRPRALERLDESIDLTLDLLEKLA